MFADFDIHIKSNTLSVLEFPLDGTKKINTLNLRTKKIISIIDNSYIPLGPRLASNGEQLIFFSNDGKLFLHHLKDKTVKIIFDHPDIHAGFCSFSKDNSKLCFSGHDGNMKTPPNIYYMDTIDQKVIQLTDGDSIDRFPQWSPSGQYIAFHRQSLQDPHNSKKVYIVDIRSKEFFQLPHNVGESHGIGRLCWSNDSTQLLVKVVTKNCAHIKIYDLRTMTFSLSLPSNNLQGGIFFSNGDKFIVVCKSELIIISLSNGEIVKKLQLPYQIPLRNTLRGSAIIASPDSELLYFLNEDSCVYQMDLKGNYKLLLRNEDALPPFKQKIYEVDSLDGWKVPVHHFTPEGGIIKKTSILLAIGGPGESIDITYDPVLVSLIKEGYEVIVPAYRGCDDYGIEHKNANKGEYGRADVWDIIACGKDWRKHASHDKSLALIGYSYGGFLTFLSMTYEETPFDYAVSLWGLTRLEYLKMHLPKAYPEDQKEKKVAKIERNPLKQVHKIKKPLLIFHGEKDTTSTTVDVQYIQKQILDHGGICDLIIYDDSHGLSKHLHEIFAHISSILY